MSSVKDAERRERGIEWGGALAFWRLRADGWRQKVRARRRFQEESLGPHAPAMFISSDPWTILTIL